MEKISLALAAAVLATGAQGAVTVTVEAAGVQTSTMPLFASGVYDFDTLANGARPTTTLAFGTSAFTAQFSDFSIVNASQFGGAGGTGKYATTSRGRSAALTITGAATNYFGFWASAIDIYGYVDFYRDTTLLSTTRLSDIPLPPSYKSNPTARFSGQDPNDTFAYVNFRVGGGYTKVVLRQDTPGGTFEYDNFRIGEALPEPGTWLMLTIGFGLVGAKLRQRKRRSVFA